MKVIDARGKSWRSYWRALYAHRHLLRTLAVRDLKIRYAQTALGLAWALLKPLTGLLIFSVFFGWLVKVDTGTTPYPLFAFAGLSAWYFFAFLVNACGMSVLQAQDLVQYMYFPKLILPLSKIISGLVEFAVNLLIMLCMLVYYGQVPGWAILFLPLVIFANVILGFTVGLWLSSLTIRRRDFQHVIPYLLNVAMWVSPVFYPSTLIPEKYAYLLFANPVAAILAGYRWTLLGGSAPSALYLISAIPVFLLLFSGIWYFRRLEYEMTDRV